MHRRFIYSFFIVFLCNILLYSARSHAQSSSQTLLEGMALLDDGSNKRDYDQILEARALFEKVTKVDSLSIWAHYYAATASSAVANMIDEGLIENGRRDLADHINTGIKHLEAAVKIDPSFADGWVLLATSYAHKISVRPFKIIGLRRKYNRSISLALELEPNNPRVILLQGIMDYFLPGIAGGNKERAEERINQAIAIFEEENITHPYRPKWGHDTAYARLGVIYMDRGDLVKARKALLRSLELNPEFGWVLQELLPNLEELESQT